MVLPHKIIYTPCRLSDLQYSPLQRSCQCADDIADVLGCSDSTISCKAKQLGLEKSHDFHKWNYIGRYVKSGVIKK